MFDEVMVEETAKEDAVAGVGKSGSDISSNPDCLRAKFDGFQESDLVSVHFQVFGQVQVRKQFK